MTSRIFKIPNSFYILIALLILGFFGNLDYSERFGCLIGGNKIFGTKNILFSSVSVLLIFSALLSQKRKFRIFFLISELIFWIFKLFYFKGGYIVSIAAIPDPAIFTFDLFTLLLRLFIISESLKFSLNFKVLLPISGLIIILKSFVFPTPFNDLIIQKEELKRSKITIQKLSGIWTGEITSFDLIKDELVDTKTVNLRIDSSYIRISSNNQNSPIETFRLDFFSEFSGDALGVDEMEDSTYYFFEILKVDKDSLLLQLNEFMEKRRLIKVKNVTQQRI